MTDLQPYLDTYKGQKIVRREIVVPDDLPTKGSSRRFTFIWKSLDYERYITSEENLFLFPPLDQIRKSMEATGYSKKEIEADIEGLSELPEYANSKGDTKSKT